MKEHEKEIKKGNKNDTNNENKNGEYEEDRGEEQ